MRRRVIVVLVLAVLFSLAFSGTALAKGPTGVSIAGPDLDEPIEVRGVSESCESGVCGDLLRAVGFFHLVFGVDEGTSPRSDIGRTPGGPVYSLVWDMGVAIPMDLYPFAEGGPLVYIAPGLYEEAAHSQSFEVPGRWFRADPVVLDLMSAYGVPLDQIPAPLASADESGFGLTTLVLTAVALVWVARRVQRFVAGNRTRMASISLPSL